MNRHESWNPVVLNAAKPISAVSNIDIEQGVLGSLLCGIAIPSAANLVPEDFSEELHGQIFFYIQEVIAKGQTPTPLLLNPIYKDAKVGGISVAVYLGRLVACAASPTVVDSYIKSLKEMRARRLLISLGSIATEIASSPTQDLASVAAYMARELDSIRSSMRDRRPSMSSLDDAISAAVAGFGQEKDTIRTGLAGLDNILGGWHRREFSIIAARPSMGKSAFLFSSLLQAAKRGTASLIFSLEMPTEAATVRMLSDMVWNSQTPVPYIDIMRNKAEVHSLDRVREAANRYKKLPVYIDDQAGLTVTDILARAKKCIEMLDRNGQRLDVIAIDHLGKIRASERYSGNKVHETGEKSNALAEMAKELDVAVIAAHQLNRAVEGRENKRPGLSDLRDSGDIEQDAETVMFLYRPAYYLERAREDSVAKEDERKRDLAECQGLLEVSIAKNRNGPCATLDFFCDMASNVVRDMVNREYR